MNSLAYFSLDPYYSLRQLYRRAVQSEAIRVLANNFGLNPLELSLQLVPVMPYTNGSHPNDIVQTPHNGLVYAYHPRDRERPDSHSNKYTGPKSEIYREIHERRTKSKKLPVWMTHRNVGKNGRIKGEGRTRIDFRRLKTLHQ
jgi:hypothetical protein